MFMKKIYKKKIFIVGSEGFLGRSLKNKIKQINQVVTSYTVETNSLKSKQFLIF